MPKHFPPRNFHRRFAFTSLLLLSATLLFSSSLHAEPSLEEKLAALEKSQAAYAKHRTPSAGFAVAAAYEALGQLVEARAMVNRVTEIPPSPAEPLADKQARANVKPALEALDTRIPFLVVRIWGVPLELVTAKVDDIPMPLDSVNSPQPTNPGKHEIVVTAPGYNPAQTTVVLAEGVLKPVEASLKLVRVGDSPPCAESPPPEDKTGLNKTFLYTGVAVSGGLAAIGLGTMIGAFILKGNANDVILRNCGESCKDEDAEFDAIESKKATLSYVSIGSFIGAGVAGGLTLAYWMRQRPSKEKDKSTGASWVVMPTTNGGVMVSGRW